MMEESKLIKSIRHAFLQHIVEHQTLSVDDLLLIAAVRIIPYMNAISFTLKSDKAYNVQGGHIESIQKSLYKHLGNSGINNFSKSAICEILKRIWLPQIEKKEDLACCFSQVKEINGTVIVLKGNDEVWEKIIGQGSGDINYQYGGQTNPNAFTLVNNQRHHNHNQDPRQAQNLHELKQAVREIFPKGLDPKLYYWEYKINQQQYDNLLAKYKNYCETLDPRRPQGFLGFDLGNHVNMAQLIALLMSEYYKRRSDNIAGDGAGDDVGTAGIMNSVWQNARLNNMLLHQEGQENRGFQNAVCVLGGLPINKIVKDIYADNNRFKDLLNGIINHEEQLSDLFDEGNRIFSRSLESGSLNQYVESLRTYCEAFEEGKNVPSMLPFSQEDIGIDPFKTFYDTLNNGLPERLKDSFYSHTYHFWLSKYNTPLQSTIDVNFNRGNVIRESQLRYLGIEAKETTKLWFNLKVTYSATQEKNIEKFAISEPVVFRNIGRGQNIFSHERESIIKMSLDWSRLKKIEVCYGGDNEERGVCYTLYDEEKEPISYKVLYYVSGYEWSTKTNKSNKKAILWNPDCCREEEATNVILQKGNWNWCVVEHPITLINTITGELERTIHPASYDNVYLDFDYSEIKKQIKISNEGIFAYYDGESKYVPLLFGSSRNDLNLRLKDIQTGMDQLIDRLEFKQEDFRYQEWSEACSPHQGFVYLRINDKIRTFSYFVPTLEGKLPVYRDLEHNRIMFSMESVCKIPTPDNIENDSIKSIEDTEPWFTSIEPVCTVPFYAVEGDDYVKLEVYRATPGSSLFRNGNKLTSRNSAYEIPLSSINEYSVLHVDEDGEKHYKCNEEVTGCILPDFNPQNPLRTIFRSGAKISPNESLYRVNYYTGRLNADNDNARHFYFSCRSKYKDFYRFYYWNQTLDGDVIEVERKVIPLEESKDVKIVLDLPDTHGQKGIVFQGFEKMDNGRFLYSNHYYSHLYEGRSELDDNLERHSRYDRTTNYTITDLVPGGTPNQQRDYYRGLLKRSYEIASQYGAYYVLFPALRAPMDENNSVAHPDDYVWLVGELLRDHNDELDSSDIDNLSRLAKEMHFDWLLLPRLKNKALLDNNMNENRKNKRKRSLVKLFKTSALVFGNLPDLSRMLEQFYFSNVNLYFAGIVNLRSNSINTLVGRLEWIIEHDNTCANDISRNIDYFCTNKINPENRNKCMGVFNRINNDFNNRINNK